MACCSCEAFTEAPLPSRPSERGCPGPGLLAHGLVSKYADHLPFYRQSQIFEREGLTSTARRLRIGQAKSTALLEPLADAIGRHVLAGQAVFVDDTPVKMLAPGTGKTATARLWTYGRDERPWDDDAQPASWYWFSPDRKGQHPKDHRQGIAAGYIPTTTPTNGYIQAGKMSWLRSMRSMLLSRARHSKSASRGIHTLGSARYRSAPWFAPIDLLPCESAHIS